MCQWDDYNGWRDFPIFRGISSTNSSFKPHKMRTGSYLITFVFIHKGRLEQYFNLIFLNPPNINQFPDSKAQGANMGPIWCRQDPGAPHVGPMNFAFWVFSKIVKQSAGMMLRWFIKTSLHEHTFRVTGPLWWEPICCWNHNIQGRGRESVEIII